MSKKDKSIKILHADAITDEFVDRCESYLSSMRCVLWGQAYDINSPARRRIAAEWLASQVVGLMLTATENET